MKNSIFLTAVLVLVGAAPAFSAGALTPEEIAEVRKVKLMVQGVDKKSLHETIKEIEKTGHPKTYLRVKEAMARTFNDIVREQDVQGQAKKEWLYSMISLNMAYLQFVGTKVKGKADSNLNRLIRHKLREYLPPDIDSHPGFFQSVD